MKVTYTRWRTSCGDVLEESTFDVGKKDKVFFREFLRYVKKSMKRWDDIQNKTPERK